MNNVVWIVCKGNDYGNADIIDVCSSEERAMAVKTFYEYLNDERYDVYSCRINKSYEKIQTLIVENAKDFAIKTDC